MNLADSLMYSQKLFGSVTDQGLFSFWLYLFQYFNIVDVGFDDKVKSDDDNVLVEYDVEANNISLGPKFGKLNSIEVFSLHLLLFFIVFKKCY